MVQATPLEMVTNGDFEEDFAVGWFERNDAISGTILRTTTAHPDPDYEAQLTVGDEGEIGLVQRFPIPDLDLAFTAGLKTQADAGNGAWSANGLMLTYRDRDWSILGNTAIIFATGECPWTESPTFHMIPAGFDIWETFSFELADELANLPGVDASAIEWLEVAVMIEAENC
jgi:hypothetical protein